MQVESICIVGGGSSGWMTAALLSKEHPELEIALIEDPNIPTIGVGESTLGHFNRFLIRLGLEDKDWMPFCDATYKSSIGFKNFREGKGERFQYPFGRFEWDPDQMDAISNFFELQNEIGKDVYPPEEFARYANKVTYLAEYNKMVEEIPDSNFRFKVHTAYHLDANKFGEFLKNKASSVHHILAKVENVIKTPDGSIHSIITDEGNTISADLFVDCTGFKSLLLEQHMGVKFNSCKDMLFNDRALATHIDYDDKETQMVPYTDCVALSNGWVYNIPLWSNIGTGYVYSSDYISDEDAEEEFRNYLPESAKDCSLMPIKIKHGVHEVGWIKNVVAIGLAYGFLEPLESTGLMTTHENAIFLSDLLSQRNGIITEHSRSVYNFSAQKTYESMKIFISMHYSLSAREDNDYWSDCTNTIEYPGVKGTMLHGNFASMDALTDYYALLDGLNNRFYSQKRLDGLIYIGAGQDISPISKAMYDEKNTVTPEKKEYIRDIHKEYQIHKKETIEWFKKQPSHYQYLKDNIHV